MNDNQKTNSFIVSQEELKIITGYKRPAEIAACLTRQGVKFLTGKRGQIWTTIGAIEFAMGSSDLFNQINQVQKIKI